MMIMLSLRVIPKLRAIFVTSSLFPSNMMSTICSSASLWAARSILLTSASGRTIFLRFCEALIFREWRNRTGVNFVEDGCKAGSSSDWM